AELGVRTEHRVPRRVAGDTASLPPPAQPAAERDPDHRRSTSCHQHFDVVAVVLVVGHGQPLHEGGYAAICPVTPAGFPASVADPTRSYSQTTGARYPSAIIAADVDAKRQVGARTDWSVVEFGNASAGCVRLPHRRTVCVDFTAGQGHNF